MLILQLAEALLSSTSTFPQQSLFRFSFSVTSQSQKPNILSLRLGISYNKCSSEAFQFVHFATFCVTSLTLFHLEICITIII